jgi:hypothetical protein
MAFLTYIVRIYSNLTSSTPHITGTFNLFVKDPIALPPRRELLDNPQHAPEVRVVVRLKLCVLEKLRPHYDLRHFEANLSNLSRPASLCQARPLFQALNTLGSRGCLIRIAISRLRNQLARPFYADTSRPEAHKLKKELLSEVAATCAETFRSLPAPDYHP